VQLAFIVLRDLQHHHQQVEFAHLAILALLVLLCPPHALQGSIKMFWVKLHVTTVEQDTLVKAMLTSHARWDIIALTVL
jgi:hypothetical protein